jgi:hypothetical protein
MRDTTILLGTSDPFLRIAEVSVGLLNKFWPEHPPIVAACEAKLMAPPVYSIRWFQGAEPKQWTKRIAEAVLYIQTPYILFWLDDYMLIEPPDEELLEAALHVHAHDPGVGRIDFNQSLPDGGKEYWSDERFSIHPKWLWCMNTQAALWKRESLLAALRALPDYDIWRFELGAGDLQNAGKLDKYQLSTNHRAMNYANLVAQGKLRGQSDLEIVTRNGFSLSESDFPNGW